MQFHCIFLFTRKARFLLSAPVIFDIAYTPFKLKKGSSEKDIAKHAKERAFFDMSGAENIYNYMTREGKIYGEESKRLTILEYLQKSTGVFNQEGMLSKDEVADMKFRVKNGEKNIWHGFISFDEQNSEKIDSPDRCISLIRKTFRPFFKDAGFDHDNMDLMCSLHLDRPTHLHIHYVFWEKEPKVKNKRAAGYIYRKKGKINFDAIADMTERLNAFAIDDELIKKRNEVEKAIWHRKDFSKAHRTDIAMREMRKLADALPDNLSWNYGSKDMLPYRSQIDDVVEAVLFSDDKLYGLDYKFKQELARTETTLKDVMSKFYKDKLNRDMIFTEHMTDAADVAGMKDIKTIERLKWDYKRRLGNIVLRKVKYIKENVYRYDKKKKHRTNDKHLKRKITIAERKIKGNLTGFLSSLLELFQPEINAYSNRLREIEKEIQADNEREQEQLNTTPTPSSKYGWGKI